MRHLLKHGPWIGVVVGGAWMMSVRPAHSKVAATLLVISLMFAVGTLFVRMLVGVTRRRNERIRGIGDAAAAALARDGFTVVDGLLGGQCHDMIAIDEQQRVALCDLGQGGSLVRVGVRAFGQSFDAALGRELAKRGLSEVPDAHVVRK